MTGLAERLINPQFQLRCEFPGSRCICAKLTRCFFSRHTFQHFTGIQSKANRRSPATVGKSNVSRFCLATNHSAGSAGGTAVNLPLLLAARAPCVTFGYSCGCKSRANQPATRQGRMFRSKVKKGVAYRTNRAHSQVHRRLKASNRVGKCGQMGCPIVIQPNRFWTVC